MEAEVPSKACPALDCGSPQPAQIALSAVELTSIGIEEDWCLGGAYRCTTCGCLYTESGSERVIYGRMAGFEWRPVGCA
jgi:hypothetical protein